MSTALGIGGVVLLISLILTALWLQFRKGEQSAEGKHAQKILDDVEEAARIRHRLLTQPSFVQRLRDKFSR